MGLKLIRSRIWARFDAKHEFAVPVVCLCWYLISSLGSQVTKRILTECPMPLFLGEFQFIFIALASCITCLIGYHVPRFRKLFPEGTFPKYTEATSHIILRPSKDVLWTVFPLGFFQFLGKYYGHCATSLVPVSTVASIKTLSPVFIILVQKLLKRTESKLNLPTYLSLGCVMLGVWTIVCSDSKTTNPATNKNSNSSADGIITTTHFGVLFAIISMLVFVLQNIYAKAVFTTKHEELPCTTSDYKRNVIDKPARRKYDKLSLMIYISAVGFILSLGWFMTLELPTLWANFFHEPHNIEIPWRLIVLNGFLHFLQSMITYYLLGEISTLSYSIANIMKRIAIISFSWLYVSHSVTKLQLLGIVLNMVGLFFYERLMKYNKIK